jgi:hypothetical protein
MATEPVSLPGTVAAVELPNGIFHGCVMEEHDGLCIFLVSLPLFSFGFLVLHLEFGPIPHLSGVLRFNGGSLYEGELSHGTRTGYGKLHYANANEYKGHFVGGKKDGHGKFSWAKGETYEGLFKNDKRSGLILFSPISRSFFFAEACFRRCWCIPLD